MLLNAPNIKAHVFLVHPLKAKLKQFYLSVIKFYALASSTGKGWNVWVGVNFFRKDGLFFRSIVYTSKT